MARGRGGYSRRAGGRVGGRAHSGGRSPNSSNATGSKSKRMTKTFDRQRGTKQIWK